MLKLQKNGDIITITLTSYFLNLHQLINNAIDKYINKKKYKLELIGTETRGTSYCYPETMEYLTHVLINQYKMTKLKLLLKTKDEKNNKGDLRNDIDNKKSEAEQITKSKDELKIEILDNANYKNVYLLEDCEDYLLEEDIYITIKRNNDIVKYILESNTKNLPNFIDNCMEKYKFSINTTNYKYKVKMQGIEKQENGKLVIYYSKKINALCNRLILRNSVNHFKTIELNGESINLIEKVTNLLVDDILINVISNVSAVNCWSDISILKLFILESNKVNVNKYLEECENEYDEYLKNKNYDTLYYFKYLGKKNNELQFSKTILESKDYPIYETFDNIFSEHSEMLIKDLEQLKNINYYKKTGMRRKKGYLFYGEPGCGKNATVLAMALKDRRHIIDIPFDILQYNSEFYGLMNLTLINNVGFTKDKIIYMFDEFHSGLEKICSNALKMQNIKTDKLENISDEDIINVITNKSNKDKISNSQDTLELGCILSVLDGIANYGGVIYTAMTNYIDKIPDPLKRSLRLTPIYFTYMRQIDVINLLESSFDIKLEYEHIQLIEDRKITPATLRMLSEKHSHLLPNINTFINAIMTENNKRIMKI